MGFLFFASSANKPQAENVTRAWWRKIWRWIWNQHLLFWWYRCWLRKDEQHRSLDLDLGAIMNMDSNQESMYRADLLRRRTQAHAAEERDFLKRKKG